MQKILEIIEKVNAAVNSVVWGWPMILLILGTGILLTVRTKALQVRKFGAAFGDTVLSTFKDIGKKISHISKLDYISIDDLLNRYV